MTRLSQLLGRTVVSETGERLGRAHDLRARRSGADIEITAIVVAGRGILERLGIGSPPRAARRRPKTGSGNLVPWTAVVRLERARIVVREGTKPE
ncbi:MAG: PRC-barrel domain-containing protein [Actinomycetota bacterium]|nr:PRC-barrel domain-containing protein [Actinomycetota bacterium]